MFNHKRKASAVTCAFALSGIAISGVAWSEPSITDRFVNEERSTLENFPFQELQGDDLADAVIEGGLAPTSAGPVTTYQPEVPQTEFQDKQTDLGRHEIPAKITFSTPKEIPGIKFEQVYQIQPNLPQNRTYGSDYNINLQER